MTIYLYHSSGTVLRTCVLREEIARAIASQPTNTAPVIEKENEAPTSASSTTATSSQGTAGNNSNASSNSLVALKEMLQSKFRLSPGEVNWDNCLVTDNLFGLASLQSASQLNVLRLFPTFPTQIFEVLEKCGWLHPIPGRIS